MKATPAARRALSLAIQVNGAAAVHEVCIRSGASQATVYRYLRGDSVLPTKCQAITRAIAEYLETTHIAHVRVVSSRVRVKPGLAPAQTRRRRSATG